MPNLTKIKVNNIDYDIKDANALTDAPADNKQYARQNGLWTEVESGGGGTEDAVLYTAQTLTSAQKAQARANIGAGTGSSNISEAPSDGKQYARKDGAWSVIVSGGGGGGDATWGSIGGDLEDQTDLVEILQTIIEQIADLSLTTEAVLPFQIAQKQDEIIAGHGIKIATDGKTISTDTYDLVISAVWVGTTATGNILGWDFELLSGNVSTVLNKMQTDDTYVPKILLRRINEYIQGRTEDRVLIDGTIITDSNQPNATALMLKIDYVIPMGATATYRAAPQCGHVYLYAGGTFSNTWDGNPYN